MLINKITRIFLLSLFIFAAHISPLSLEGRLPGEFFREDNPARYGALMSFVSTSDSVVVLHATKQQADLTIANQLKKIAQGFKLKVVSLQKLNLIEGSMRWLQYSFRKKNGGGYIYITRQENRIIYLVIFNLNYNVLFRDLPYIERYVKQLQLNMTTSE